MSVAQQLTHHNVPHYYRIIYRRLYTVPYRGRMWVHYNVSPFIECNKKFVIMLTRRAKAYSSSGSR